MDKTSKNSVKQTPYPSFAAPTVQRAHQISKVLPLKTLEARLNAKSSTHSKRNVLHWFRTKDLRIHDNKALNFASQIAQDNKSQLITTFILNPEELKAHGSGDLRNQFMVDNIKQLAAELKELGIPLIPLVATTHKSYLEQFNTLFKEFDIDQLTANFEYEVDELNRDIYLVENLSSSVAIAYSHDQTCVQPGIVTSASGPKKVFTQYWGDWIRITQKQPALYTKLLDPPAKQDSSGLDHAFELVKQLDFEELLGLKDVKVNTEVWPIGHKGALHRLSLFLESKIFKYAELRSNPAADNTSRMSPYFALGVISIRETLNLTRIANNNKSFGTSGSGVDQWVRELVFREFYRHLTAVVSPHITMNMPTNLKLTRFKTSYDDDKWTAWCEGRTGIPLVDAGMRQLKHEGFMHNRVRMNVASFLKLNMHFDYRLGMTYFANNLIDWDCINNCFGWDPSGTAFNPMFQASKFDPKGEYIKQWVPELRNAVGKQLFHYTPNVETRILKSSSSVDSTQEWRNTKEEGMNRYNNCFKSEFDILNEPSVRKQRDMRDFVSVKKRKTE